MHTKNRDYQLTADLLLHYRDAALVNAQELLEEAALLLGHGRYARAYFLAASSIEEVGKAVQAFEGMGRNLSDSTVTHRLKLQFEDHSQKVTSAFSPWIQASSDIRAEIMDFVRSMVDLKFGREASMYTDIHAERLIVTTPLMQVHKGTATNCVRLAGTVLAHARPYARQSQPKVTTKVQDTFFALKPKVFQKMANTGDFWEYYICQLEQGEVTLESAVTRYNTEYLAKSKLFKPEPNQADIPPSSSV